jgi:crotonobetainyl-CoA:carnitine CoA-transferase CaiB-like acyl-CoA transferase
MQSCRLGNKPNSPGSLYSAAHTYVLKPEKALPAKNFERILHMNTATLSLVDEKPAETLTETLQSKLSNPATASGFDRYGGVNEVLKDVGMTAADSGGKLTFYGQDPIVPSRVRFARPAGTGLAAKTIAAAAVWRHRTGQGQDIHVDVRKAYRRFSGVFEGIWETVNGRSPAMGFFENNPFLKSPLFRETRDGRHITTLSFYPKTHQRALNLLRCSDSLESVQNSILQWPADDLETAAAEQGLVLAKVRTNEEFRRELQYSEVLAKMPLKAWQARRESGDRGQSKVLKPTMT